MSIPLILVGIDWARMTPEERAAWRLEGAEITEAEFHAFDWERTESPTIADFRPLMDNADSIAFIVHVRKENQRAAEDSTRQAFLDSDKHVHLAITDAGLNPFNNRMWARGTIRNVSGVELEINTIRALMVDQSGAAAGYETSYIRVDLPHFEAVRFTIEGEVPTYAARIAGYRIDGAAPDLDIEDITLNY